jgi:hypothetical protein
VSYTKLVLHVAGHSRHAQVERVLAGSDPDSLELFFHHADHLGSGHVLTREDGGTRETGTGLLVSSRMRIPICA